MCGIVGYVGPKQAYPLLISGLHRLEYRGYDSAGIAINNGELHVYKCKGKVSDLENTVKTKSTEGTIGIGHTRWATHGIPNDVNAHPHTNTSQTIALVHNGIIENYAVLKDELQKRGYTFVSQTDTEVLVHLIEDVQKNTQLSLEESVRLALQQVIGAYAIVVLSKQNPHELIVAKKGSPLVIGIGENEYFIASDATPIIEHTNKVVYLEDEEMAVISRHTDLRIKTIRNQEKTPYIQQLEMKLEALQKGGYDHFMLKEIYEQPQAIENCLRGRLRIDKKVIQLGGIQSLESVLEKTNRILFVACGTSLHAGMVGEYAFEMLAGISAEIEYASEFRYRQPIISPSDVVVAISQSGETADTLAALNLAKSAGCTVTSICNVVGSSIARATGTGLYTHAGPEIGVASTKAFTTQVSVLLLMAIHLAFQRGKINQKRYEQLITSFHSIPRLMQRLLDESGYIKELALEFKSVHDAMFLGRGFGYPVALEGALKLKEIAYVNAQGYPAGEMKHGHIALVTDQMPVIAMATQGEWYEKMVSNIQEVKARKGRVIALVSQGDTQVKSLADHTIELPYVEDIFMPLISVIPLQLFAYHMAVLRGCNVDQPRNLAKSVTVE